ncbi:MAG: DUF2939 domain-containing protein [Gammaproteobacteria bacterium]|nr:DUF2939 domain-containing protein [Gammaproteobacteria bacterium]
MKLKVVSAALFVLVFGYLFATPYITVYQLKIAAENNDAEALEKHVNFVVLRENLKTQMHGRLGRKMEKKALSNNPFAALGAAFGSIMVDTMLDVYITPEGLVELMEGRKPALKGRAKAVTTGQQPAAKPFPDATMTYESLNTFAITLPKKDIKFLLSRNGLVWQVTDITLPQ